MENRLTGLIPQKITVSFALVVPLIIAALSTGTSLDPRTKELAAAKRELKISEATEARIAAELKRLNDSREASPEVIRDYETYLDRVRQMVWIQKQIVAEMEAAYNKRVPTEGAVTENQEEDLDSRLPDEDQYDAVAHLDREFDDSLAEFDDLLLREMEAIRIRKSDEMRDLAEEAAEAAQRLRDRGIDVDTSASGEGKTGEMSGGGEGQDAAGEDASAQTRERSEEQQSGARTAAGGPEGGMTTEGSTEQPGTKTEESGQSGSKGGASGQDSGVVGHTQAYDDDIVARQLREAAERETDPELRKKLWKEYEDYKRGTEKKDEESE